MNEVNCCNNLSSTMKHLVLMSAEASRRIRGMIKLLGTPFLQFLGVRSTGNRDTSQQMYSQWQAQYGGPGATNVQNMKKRKTGERSSTIQDKKVLAPNTEYFEERQKCITKTVYPGVKSLPKVAEGSKKILETVEKFQVTKI